MITCGHNVSEFAMLLGGHAHCLPELRRGLEGPKKASSPH